MKKNIKKRKGIPIGKLIVVLFLILLTFIIYSGGKMIWASTVETVDVVCIDENLYKALKSRLSKKIIESNDETKTLEVIKSEIPQITELDLSSYNITNLNGIENLTGLSNLNLAKNKISDTSKLTSLQNLSVLNLSNNQVSNITNICELTNLTNLNLASNKNITDITGISALEQLEILNISDNGINDASEIRNLNKLTSLNIAENSSFSHISDILMSQLVNLNISKTAVMDIETIDECQELVELNISGTRVSNLQPLFKTEKVEGKTVAKLRKLSKLDISNLNINVSFNSLNILSALTELYARKKQNIECNWNC